jgi:hypothetical protein
VYVFIHGDGERPPPAMHFMMATPAADIQGEVPASWVDTLNRPKEFQLQFVHGRAEVDDELGKYLIKKGYAHKSGVSLFKPPPGWE